MSKRKAEAVGDARPAKRHLISEAVSKQFRPDLFNPSTLDSYKTKYKHPEPYQHGVISDLIQPALLRSVRTEIIDNVSFTPKETDIYKIHQSGDLANLDGLDDASLARLPSLAKLRDAMYSRDFRKYLSEVTGAGKLSGKKTDMAVNVYTPGCHLLCHDDVIGSRRVSYILYLMDPDVPWQKGWGGALRLYPTERRKIEKGEDVLVPKPDHSVSIPPAFNQLSFFAVQPGQSYHDVEEVYARGPDDDGHDGGRLRMAISGWYHIPQEGEEGYEAGAEEAQAEKSSLAQLQGRAEEFDEPKMIWFDSATQLNEKASAVNKEAQSEELAEDTELTEEDLNVLIEYINPRYLVPETVSALRAAFEEESSLRLGLFLSDKYVARLRPLVEAHDNSRTIVTGDSTLGEDVWSVACPPHKHRYLYIQPSPGEDDVRSKTSFMNMCFSQPAFRKWLGHVTGLKLGECAMRQRRFRRGKDYQLAMSYNDDEPQLEATLGLTPTEGWGQVEGEDQTQTNGDTNEQPSNGISEKESHNDQNDLPKVSEATAETGAEGEVGGYEAYMAGDDDDSEVDVPTKVSSTTGAGQRRSAKPDPAVYQSKDEEEDDGVLFTQPASWNTLTVVLRDKGTMRFVKYVSQSAKGDRWDVTGAWKVLGEREDDDSDGEDDDEESDHEGEDG